MLDEAASPPLCVGLYAKWGVGKSFLIGLLKKNFDKTAREHQRTHDLVQWHEDDFSTLPPAITDIEASKQVAKDNEAAHEAANQQKAHRARMKRMNFCKYFCLMAPKRVLM
jgi:hypothetical protein